MTPEEQLKAALKQLAKADEMLSITKRYRGLFSKQNFGKWREENNKIINQNNNGKTKNR
jgi:hypothetical protein